MDHDLELFIPILEILEIEVCNILYNPGNIEKKQFFLYLISWKYWRSAFFQFSTILEILENCFCLASTILEVYGKLIFHICS